MESGIELGVSWKGVHEDQACTMEEGLWRVEGLLHHCLVEEKDPRHQVTGADHQPEREATHVSQMYCVHINVTWMTNIASENFQRT